MTRHRPGTPLRDRGASSLEYVASISVAAIVLVTVVLGVSNAHPDSGAARAICRVMTLGLGDCGSAVTDARKIPTQRCVLGSDSSTLTARAGVAVLGQGSERWLIEQLDDGRVRLTRSLSSGVGGGLGVGFELTGTWNDQDYGGSLGADANAFGVAETGEIYYVDSTDQAKKFLNERRVSDVLAGTVGGGGPVRGLIDKIRGGTRLPEPDETWTAVGSYGDAKATFDWIAAGAQAEASNTNMLGVRLRKDGSSTAYFATSFSAQAAASFWAADGDDAATTLFKAQTAGTFGGSAEVDFDANHNPVALRIKTTLGGSAAAQKRIAFEKDGKGPNPNAYVDRTIEIPLNTPQARAAAARALVLAGIVAVPGLPIPPGTDLRDTGDIFAEAIRQGKMWEDNYDLNHNTDGGFAFEAAWLAKVGVEGSKVSTTRDGHGQRYFDGVSWRDREECGT